MHQHFQEGLVANALSVRDLAGLREIGFGQRALATRSTRLGLARDGLFGTRPFFALSQKMVGESGLEPLTP